MTALSFQATDINFDRQQSAFVETANSINSIPSQEPRITKFEIRDISNAPQITAQAQIVSTSIPMSLQIAYWSFGIVSIFFLLQFILTFFQIAILPGFSGLVGFFAFGGLFKVTQRIHKEIKQNGFIQ